LGGKVATKSPDRNQKNEIKKESDGYRGKVKKTQIRIGKEGAAAVQAGARTGGGFERKNEGLRDFRQRGEYEGRGERGVQRGTTN